MSKGTPPELFQKLLHVYQRKKDDSKALTTCTKMESKEDIVKSETDLLDKESILINKDLINKENLKVIIPCSIQIVAKEQSLFQDGRKCSNHNNFVFCIMTIYCKINITVIINILLILDTTLTQLS